MLQKESKLSVLMSIHTVVAQFVVAMIIASTYPCKIAWWGCIMGLSGYIMAEAYHSEREYPQVGGRGWGGGGVGKY